MKTQLPEFNSHRISRREFLRFSAMAAAALGSGYLLGKFSAPARVSELWLQAFLPPDEQLVLDLAQEFWRMAGGTGSLQISAPQPWESTLAAAARRSRAANGASLARLEMLNQPLPADILMTGAGGRLYDPGWDFSTRLAHIRTQVHGEPALLSLSLGCMAAQQAPGGPCYAHIYDQRGLVERLSLDRDYHDISLDGLSGRTHVQVESGRLWVQQASCRARLCQKSGPIMLPGQRCACAPNRLVIEVVAG